MKKEQKLEYLFSEEAWTENWPCDLSKKELATTFKRTIQVIKHSVEAILWYQEWRKTNNDTDPVTSTNWNSKSQIFTPDLRSTRSIAQQIDDTTFNWWRDSRLCWFRPGDKEIFKMIADSPLPPIIAINGSHEDGDN